MSALAHGAADPAEDERGRKRFAPKAARGARDARPFRAGARGLLTRCRAAATAARGGRSVTARLTDFAWRSRCVVIASKGAVSAYCEQRGVLEGRVKTRTRKMMVAPRRTRATATSARTTRFMRHHTVAIPDYDDDDFTAGDMCCGCTPTQGGEPLPTPAPSVSPFPTRSQRRYPRSTERQPLLGPCAKRAKRSRCSTTTA